MANVRFDRVTKVFPDSHRGAVIAVHDANFEIEDGEFVVILGPSGCGKTTSLRMIGGLEVPTSGDIWIGDRVVNRLHPRARNVAMVFQDYALYPHMTVRNNLSFGLRNLGVPRAEIEREVARVAEMLQISPLLNRRPRELSGGQRQRVALGRAIVRSPQLFLFDEPLSNLDAKLRVQMRVELRELQEQLGTTAVYVTHDQVEAMTLGQRIIVMNYGIIQQIDSPARLYDHPNNMFVAQFIGTPPMNLVYGELDGEGKFVGKDFLISLPSAFFAQHRSHAGEELYMGLRPEDIRISTGDERSATGDIAVGRFRAMLRAVEYLGAETLVYFELGGQVCTARIARNIESQVHDVVEFACDFKRAALFDSQSQRRLTP